MKYFSTFSGAGGFEIGINEKGVCVGHSEINKYAIQVYEKHYPTHKNYGDISKIEWSRVPDFDLLVGGSPCQDLSIAGKRKGLAGGRSGLFYHYIRALKEKQPKYFIWENVRGALSSNNGWDFAEVQNEFSKAGYSITWQVLNSKHFGVPQNRERIFVIGTRGECAREVFFERPSTDEHSDKTIEQGCATTLTVRGAGGGNRRGNYIIQINKPKHSNNRIYETGGVAPTLNTMQGGNRQPFILIPEPTRLGYAIVKEGDSINLSVPNSKTRRGRVGHGVAQTLDTGMQQYTLVKGRVRRLTELECERIMGWPDGHTAGVSSSQRYKICGNGVVSNVVHSIIEKLI